MPTNTLRRITEDDLARVMAVNEDAVDLEIMAHKFCGKPYVTQDDISQLYTIAMNVRKVDMIMRRFLSGHMDVQVVMGPDGKFSEVQA